MLEFTLRHELACTPARHWILFFDADWTKSLIIDGLGFDSCQVEPVVTDGDLRRRQMRVTPKVELPRAVAKILGDKLGYTERGEFDDRREVWRYELVLNVLSDKIRLGGEVTTEPKGDDRLTRVSKMWVEAKIFGVGGMIEKAAEKNMRDGWDRSAAWFNRWLADHPPE